MFHAAAFDKDMDKALPLYRQLMPLLPFVGGPRYVSGTKMGFRLMGMSMGSPRPPRLPLPGADTAALSAVLQKLGLLSEGARQAA
ncbi:MAG: dihydrodipicolinate synthase family protein, partial [Roseomonas sp.]|nr:dihydrodipicolinate synthase family protein [Roseomonas sp.]